MKNKDLCTICSFSKDENHCIFCGSSNESFIQVPCKHKVCSVCKTEYDNYSYVRKFYFPNLQKCQFCTENGTISCQSQMGELILCATHFKQKFSELQIKDPKSIICQVNHTEKSEILQSIQSQISKLNRISESISESSSRIIKEITQVSQDSIKKCLFEIKNYMSIKNSLASFNTISIADYLSLKQVIFFCSPLYKPQIDSLLASIKKKLSFSTISENLQDSHFLYYSTCKNLLASINIRTKSIQALEQGFDLKLGFKGQLLKIAPNEYFAFGGIGKPELTQAYLVNPAANQITPLKKAPYSLHSSGCVLYKNSVLMFSGVSAGLRFNLKTQNWAQISQFPEQLGLGASQVVHNEILVTGEATEKLMAYNQASNTFKEFSKLPPGCKLFFFDLVLVNGSGIYQITPDASTVQIQAGLNLGTVNLNCTFTAVHKNQLYYITDKGTLLSFNYQTHKTKLVKF